MNKSDRNVADPMVLLEMSEEEEYKMKEIQDCLLNIEETVKRLEE